MKNMKIKSYTFKKNSVLNKGASSSKSTKTENSSNLNSNTNTSNNGNKPSLEYSNLKHDVLSDVEKILKTPGLNLGNISGSENKINIKLNINSEVINNNIRINQNKSLKNEKSSGGVRKYKKIEENYF
jgi:hypothetical protein